MFHSKVSLVMMPYRECFVAVIYHAEWTHFVLRHLNWEVYAHPI